MTILRAAIAFALLSMPHATPPQDAASSASTKGSASFGIGERLEYDVQLKLGFFPSKNVGDASMELVRLDTVRGRTAWHAAFILDGGIPFCRVRDRFTSWLDSVSLSTLRFGQDIRECSYKALRTYEFLPEQRRYFIGKDTMPTVENPFDEASILYSIRRLPLRPGLDTALSNYFMPDRNPIRIQVLRRERIKVKTGSFDALLIKPSIKMARGMFAEGADAKVWLSDDDRRIMLRMETNLRAWGQLNLVLKSYKPARP